MRLFPIYFSGTQSTADDQGGGGAATTFVDQLEEDAGLSKQELPAVMAERGECNKLIKLVQVHLK